MSYQLRYKRRGASESRLLGERDTMTESILLMREWEAMMHRAGLRMRDVRIEGAREALALGVEVIGAGGGARRALVWIEQAAGA